MTGEKEIKIGEMEITDEKEILVARALGSCVAVAIYDRQNEVGGMAHVLLGKGNKHRENKPAFYADKAIENLVKEVRRLGGRRENLEAKIVGGASMFSSQSKRKVGEKNVEAVIKELDDRNIPVKGKDIGGTHARNVRFKVGSMSIMVEYKI
ncbi:MAG: chemotaxis protein CheD [Candidatus Thermoplasmatota archaeon]|nr:chemotaxis protein CheD [Candidatus Thermoplasmatota archaeon]MBS3790824.1 chemotaxis protein CheD [Candidatus Thermoplasmatota archaeon]